jgi:hypothetical protein
MSLSMRRSAFNSALHIAVNGIPAQAHQTGAAALEVAFIQSITGASDIRHESSLAPSRKRTGRPRLVPYKSLMGRPPPGGDAGMGVNRRLVTSERKSGITALTFILLNAYRHFSLRPDQHYNGDTQGTPDAHYLGV